VLLFFKINPAIIILIKGAAFFSLKYVYSLHYALNFYLSAAAYQIIGTGLLPATFPAWF